MHGHRAHALRSMSRWSQQYWASSAHRRVARQHFAIESKYDPTLIYQWCRCVLRGPSRSVRQPAWHVGVERSKHVVTQIGKKVPSVVCVPPMVHACCSCGSLLRLEALSSAALVEGVVGLGVATCGLSSRARRVLFFEPYDLLRAGAIVANIGALAKARPSSAPSVVSTDSKTESFFGRLETMVLWLYKPVMTSYSLHLRNP